jgi:hypothetical protein
MSTLVSKIIAVSLCLTCLIVYLAPVSPASPARLIRDNQGRTWAATADGLVDAFNALRNNSQLWIPAGNYTITDTNLCITKNGVTIHGTGPKTLIYFKNGARLISGRYADANNDHIRYSHGVDNLLLANFKISGVGNMELVLGNNTRLQGIWASYIYEAPTPRSAAIRFVLPLDNSSCHGLSLFNCHTSRTFNHGFQINGLQPDGHSTLTDVRFTLCSASYAGWRYPGRTADWNWSVGFDLGEGYDHCHVNEPDILVQYCWADHNWESGFHIESSVQRNLTFIRCISNYNGQKRIVYPNATQYFASGFIAENNVTILYCLANYNTNRGIMWRNNPLIIGMRGVGNWNGLY